MMALPATEDLSSREELPSGWDTYRVFWKDRKGIESWRTEIVSQRTGERFQHEPMLTTAFKCFLLVVFTPVYLLGYMGFHFLRTPLTMLATVARSIYLLGSRPSWPQVLQLGKDLCLTAPHCFLKGCAAMLKAPFYSISLQVAALYGMVRPLEGRAWVGFIERKWHGTDSHRADFTYALDRMSLEDVLLHSFCDKDFPYTFYLAFCMQKLGHIEDAYLTRKEKL